MEFVLCLLATLACFELPVLAESDFETLNILQERLDVLEQNIQDLQTLPITHHKSSLDKPSFSARLSADATVFEDEVVIFDDVIWGNYSSTLGYFNVPNDGTYSYTVTISSPPAKTSQASIKLTRVSGGSPSQISLAKVKTYMYDALDKSGTHSATVMVECLAGDQISVHAVGEPEELVEYLGADGSSVFTGYEI